MAKKDKKKSLIQKLKSSPAAKVLKEEGPIKAIKTAGKYAKEDIQDLADKAADSLFPGDTTHMQTRMQHFNQGTQEHMVVRSEDVPQAGRIVERYHQKGEVPQPFKEGNVSSIMNAFEIRERKAPPEGY